MDLTTLFVEPPGNTIYYLLIIALAFAMVWLAFSQRRVRAEDAVMHARARLTLTVFGVTVMWLALFVFVIVADGQDTLARLLPLTEQAVVAVIALLIAWSLVEVKQAALRKRINRWFGGWFALIIAAYVASAVYWSGVADPTVYAGHMLNVLWAGLTLIVSLVTAFLLIVNIKQILDTPIKALLFLFLALGSIGVLVVAATDNIQVDPTGIMRLAVLAMMVVYTAVVYRMVIDTLVATVESQATKKLESQHREMPKPMPQPQEERPHVSPIERESVQLMRALGLMMENATPQSVPGRIVDAVIEVLKVDVAVLMRVKDANYADVEVAYDRFMERTISGIAINLDNQPTLVNAIERRTQRMLLDDEHLAEMNDIYARLDIEQVGPVYMQPMYRDDNLIAILMAAMPYSKRELLRSEYELLKGISVIASGLLEMSFAALDAQMLAEERAIQAMVNRVSPNQIEDQDVLNVRRQLEQNLALAREQIAALNGQVASLKGQIDTERDQLAQDLGDSHEMLSVSQQMESLYNEQDQLRAERDTLAQRLQEAEAVLQSASNTSSEDIYEEMVQLLREEKEALIAQRDSMEAELDALRNRSGGLIDPRDMQTMLRRVEAERSRLEAERDRYQARFDSIRRELNKVGVQADDASFLDVLRQLTAQRAQLQEENAALKQKVESMAMTDGEADSERLQLLQATLRNVAGDREVALKQRDKYARELDDLKDKLRLLKRRWQQLEGRAQKAQQERQTLQETVRKLQDDQSRLINVRDRLEAEKQALEMNQDQLLARIEGDRERIVELGDTGVGSLTTMIEDLTEQRESLQLALNEVREQLDTANAQIADLQEQLDEVTPGYEPQDPDLLVSMVQELRSPMTSMAGYLDLLLSESSGILGDMQRKFLLRVHTNMQRFDSMLDDLIRVTELDAGKFKPTPVPVNITELIEDSITHAARQFREKGLTVNLVFEDGLPPLQIDRDALNEVIGQLLTNAYLVSPPDSEITIRVEKQESAQINGHRADSLFVSVEDRGGGISSDDEPRVFARKYKAENPLIQGLGDTGVGLSIAKTLVQSQGGRLWLESDNGVGSRFNFLLPVHGGQTHNVQEEA